MAEPAEKTEKKEADPTENKVDGADSENPSMEDILKSIRGVISGDEDSNKDSADKAEDSTNDEPDEDILELTEMEIAEDEPATEVAAETPDSPAAEPEPVAEEVEAAAEEEKSVLDEIDSALEEDAEEAVNSAPEENTTPEEEANVEEAATTEEEVDLEGDDDVLEAEVQPEPEAVAESEKAIDEAEKPESEEKVAGKALLNEKTAEESADTLKTLVNNIPKAHVDSPVTRGGTSLEDLVIEAMKPFLAEWLNENLPTIVKQIVTKEIKKLIPQEED